MSSCNADALIVSGDKLAAFEKLTQGSGSTPLYALFYSPTCPHCIIMNDAFQRYRAQCVENKAKATLVVVNQNTAPELFAKYGVEAVPQVMVFKQGKRVKHIVGANLSALSCAFRMADLQLTAKKKEVAFK